MTDTLFIHSKDDLINYFMQANKPKNQWRIGVEHEKLLLDAKSFSRISYEKGIEVILRRLQSFGWTPIFEQTTLIGLKRGNASISLEPGGQFELSGAPLTTIHEIRDELNSHLVDLKSVTDSLGIDIIGLGIDPISSQKDIPWMPKERYRLMKQYMPTRGQYGVDMMTSTCTVQVNLDFSSEEDMVLKFKVAMALQPLATALFANSSIKEGHDSGFASYRAAIWQDTDPDRCGLLPFVFEPGLTFEKYMDYALTVPMYFVKRNETYLSALGLSFQDFLQGKLSVLPGELPKLTDWEDHLSTLFPEVRLKQYLELRGADAGTSRHILALPAFWVGLLYDQENLQEAYDIIKKWPYEDLQNLYHSVPRLGLQADFQQKKLKEWARQFLKLAQKGLERRHLKDENGIKETQYLSYLEERLASSNSDSFESLELFIKKHTF